MLDLLTAFLTVIIGVGTLVGFLGALYWLSNRLPASMRERARVVIFLGPAIVFIVIGLVAPALRTLYFSLRDDNGKKFVWL